MIAPVVTEMEQGHWLAAIIAVEASPKMTRFHALLLRLLQKVAAPMGNMYSGQCISTEIAGLKQMTQVPRHYGSWKASRGMLLRQTGFLFCA